ncbi:MAG: type II toxin-antitoxin system Phd/YefM family antitoxin [Thermodesulfobacteriota bacterium]
MDTIGAHKAKIHFPKLLERVIKGERITITKHGLPVAILQSPPAVSKTAPETVIAELRKFRARHDLKEIPIRDTITEGRR